MRRRSRRRRTGAPRRSKSRDARRGRSSGGGEDLGADPVAGQGDDRVGHATADLRAPCRDAAPTREAATAPAVADQARASAVERRGRPCSRPPAPRRDGCAATGRTRGRAVRAVGARAATCAVGGGRAARRAAGCVDARPRPRRRRDAAAGRARTRRGVAAACRASRDSGARAARAPCIVDEPTARAWSGRASSGSAAGHDPGVDREQLPSGPARGRAGALAASAKIGRIVEPSVEPLSALGRGGRALTERTARSTSASPLPRQRRRCGRAGRRRSAHLRRPLCSACSRRGPRGRLRGRRRLHARQRSTRARRVAAHLGGRELRHGRRRSAAPPPTGGPTLIIAVRPTAVRAAASRRRPSAAASADRRRRQRGDARAAHWAAGRASGAPATQPLADRAGAGGRRTRPIARPLARREVAERGQLGTRDADVAAWSAAVPGDARGRCDGRARVEPVRPDASSGSTYRPASRRATRATAPS